MSLLLISFAMKKNATLPFATPVFPCVKLQTRCFLWPFSLLCSTLPLAAETATVYLRAAADTRIFDASWGWNSNAGSGTDMGVYQSRDRSLLQFNFGALPTGFTVNSSVLALTATELYGGNANAESMNIFRLTQGWTEGGVTWNTYDGTNPWTTVGGTRDSTVMATSTANPNSGSQLTWDITSLAQGWANNTWANHGLIIINSGTTNGLHFATDEHGNASYRPVLTMSITTATSPAGGAWIWNGGAGGGSAVDGAGVWTDTNLWWNGAAATWADGNDAVFGAGSGTAGTVTISGTVAPKSIWFQPTGGGNYTLDGGTIDLAGNVSVIHTSVNGTINSTITNGTIFKQGSATLTLAGTNSHAGGTTIAGGTLKAASSAALGAAGNLISVSPGATLDINGQTLNGYTENIRIAGSGATASQGALGNSGATNMNAIRGITLTGNASIGGDNRWDIGRLDFNADPNVTVNHIDGGGFVLTKVGSNEIGLLSGAINLAGVVMNEGILSAHENTSFGSGPVTLNGGVLQPWGGLTTPNAFTVNGGTIRQATNHNDNYTGAFTLNAASTFDVATASLTVSGPMSGSGAISKTGGGLLVLSGNNTQTGTLSVNGGTVRFASGSGFATNGSVNMLNNGSFLLMGAPNQFGPNAGVSFNSASYSELALYGHNQTIASLASAHTFAVVQNSHGGYGAATASSTLTVNQSTDTTYHGIIRDNTGNDAFTLALVKDGSGTLTLNTISAHSGGTTVNGGTLAIASYNGNSGVKGTLVVNAGSTVTVAGDGTGLGYNPGQKITSLTVNGGTVTSAAGMHIWAIGGGVNMTGGTLQSNSGVSDAGGPTLEWNNTNVTTNASASTATIGGRIRMRTDNGATGITFNVADGAAATDLLLSAAITESGAQSITKQGAGTMVLTGANNYSGVTNITAGTVIGASNTALGVGGHNGATMTFIQDGATLGLQGGVSLDEHFHVWGSGVGGLGAVRSFSGNNTLTNAPGGGAGFALRSDTTVGVDADKLTVSGFYEDGGSFDLTKVGAGTLALTVPSTYTGGTAVNAGTLLLGANNPLPDASALSLSAGAKLATGGFSDSTGAFTLAGDAILDFGAGSSSSLTFADISAWTGVLKIYNYDGGVWTAGADKLFFTSNTLAPNMATGVEFYSDAGATLIGAGGGFLTGTTGELVPVPEPGLVGAVAALLGTLGWRERRFLLRRR